MQNTFTEKQREVVARRMGYEGPMQMFDEYLKSSPADARKFGLIETKFMAKGGVVKKEPVKMFAGGGITIGAVSPSSTEAVNKMTGQANTPAPVPDWVIAPPAGSPAAAVLTTLTNPKTGETYTAPSGGYRLNEAVINAGDTPQARPPGGIATEEPPSQRTLDEIRQVSQGQSPIPIKPGISAVAPAQTRAEPGQIVYTELAPTQAATAAPSAAAPSATAAAPTITPAATMEAFQAAPAIQAATQQMQPAQGTVSAGAQTQAAQAVPTATAVGDLQAAQGTATQITGAPTRTIQAGEMISGPAVNMARVEQDLAKAEAAQGVVTEDMTVQGQLAKLTANFETGNPPAWAAASLRNATAQMAARGLGASSLAGQAIIQATLEAATPIASADAAVYQQMGLQNLSNRQQVAVLTAQQRAQFLGQEFDQTFQTRVTNAARVADIANMNFTAQQQIALENARMAQTMDLANLSNRQAVVMAEAAQIANLETANLNNRQQAAVLNAKAFLDMDMANLSNEQQSEMFKSQSIVQGLLTDQAAVNASRQFNASSQNQTDQFFANLATTVKQFNAQQTNAMSQFNVDQANTVSRFNAEVQNQRDQFNAQNRLVIDQSNAQWRREIATANTAAINRANEFNATKAMELTTIEYNNMWQQFRDEIEYSWKSAENAADRVNQITRQEISSNATVLAAAMAKDAALTETIGKAAATILGGTNAGSAGASIFGDIIKGGYDLAKSTIAGAWDSLFGFDPGSVTDNIIYMGPDTQPDWWRTESYD